MVNKHNQALKLLKSGDKRGLKEVFDLLYTPLCLFSQKFVGNLDTAEDIVQDVFIAFWEKKAYQNIKSSLSSYLYQTVRNRSINYLRDQKIKTSEWLDDYFDVYEEMDDGKDYKEKLLSKVNKAISELPEGSREVFKSIVINGLSYKQAAENHGISINTIKSQLKRATKILSQKLDPLSFLLFMHFLFGFFEK